jgi:Tfp pilus assembly protein PilN
VLPPEHRRFSSRTAFIPTLVLTALVLLALAAAAVYSNYADRRYLRKLEAEIALYEPQAQRVALVDRQMNELQARTRVLDTFRQQTRKDLDALNELTRLVEPPAWTSATNLTRDSARITGEAPQASPLLKILDSSPLFEGSSPDSISRSPTGAGEMFQIHMNRRAAK